MLKLGLLSALGLVLAGGYLLWGVTRPATVTLSWETGSERDVAGFNVWRSGPPEPAGGATAAAVKVNPGLIPAQGNAQTGAAYSFQDAGVERGAAYSYQVEEVALDGAAHRLPEVTEADVPDRRPLHAAEGIGAIALGLYLLAGHRRAPTGTAPGTRPPA